MTEPTPVVTDLGPAVIDEGGILRPPTPEFEIVAVVPDPVTGNDPTPEVAR